MSNVRVNWIKLGWGSRLKATRLTGGACTNPNSEGLLSTTSWVASGFFSSLLSRAAAALIPNHLQANISLFEDLDIYVEMVLMHNEIIIINAHDHTPNVPRLPQ